MSDPRIEQPTPEVEKPGGDAALPGASRGYGKLPTAPVPVEQAAAVHPEADEQPAEWEPSTGGLPVDDARLAPWALVAAVVALATSMFVGWGIPVAIIAVIAAIMSLRRPIENRSVAVWALVLGLCATLFSAGWLLWAAMQLESLG
ncbi:hypothetical protein FVO59_09585 [Microbacterium esteraromaticum]|uniref:DUF4190 domain-containing protein n=1 Tax=Microbacterium esteraromaticum TaxID=57043 RepID=A0A7D8ABW9_9MICO|nr:hypothetical protein [Microbacterium esteraromaticum]QMU97441.1 hypothetical protein FVO59_09585 [Microbacterium esteraromaticum]